MNRLLHIDFHNLPGINDFGSEFCAEHFAEKLKETNVAQATIFAQCNLGFSYYPTKVGTPYPSLKCDMFGETVRALRKAGIRVVAYVNAGVNHELARKHAEFCRVNEDGQIISGDKTDNFSRTMCFHNAGYRKYMAEIVKEILQYDIDGMFFDCIFARPCYCNDCMEGILRSGINIQDCEAVASYALEEALDFGKMLKNLLPKGLSFYVNGLPYDRMEKVNTHIEIECLPGSWGYDYFPAMAAYARKLSEQVVYMSGRFQKDWGDFGGYKTLASLENDAFDALEQGCGFCVGDHLHPRGNIESKLYHEIEKVFRRLKEYEPWTKDTHYVAEIALLRNRSGSKISLLTGSLQGAARMLTELKYDFDVINEDMDFTNYRLLILADQFVIAPKTKEKLEAFLANGGAVLSSGDAGVDFQKPGFGLDVWENLTYCGKEEGQDGQAGYYRLSGETRDIAAYCPGILMRTDNRSEQIAERVLPYFPRHWDGRHGYFYTPPKGPDGCAAAVCNSHAAHIAFPIFRAYYLFAYQEHRKLVSSLIHRLYREPLVKADELPISAAVTVTESDAHTLLHIKITRPEYKGQMNVIEEHDILPAGRKVLVRGNYRTAVSVPDGACLQTISQNGYIELTLPEICGYHMFCLQRGNRAE